jgi:hypothetical protein
MKKIVFITGLVLVSFLLLPVLSSPITKSQWVYSYGLFIRVESPREVGLNESFNVIVTLEPVYKIYVESILVEFDNPNLGGDVLFNTELDSVFSKTFTLKPESNGSVNCHVRYYYVVNKGTYREREYEGSFELWITSVKGEARITTISEETYEDFLTDYLKDFTGLKWRYWILERELYLENEDYLEAANQLNKERIKTNGLILTTLVFFATTIYFAWESIKKNRERLTKG